MNVGDIKAGSSDQKPAIKPEQNIRSQLREDGLRQAAEFQQKYSGTVSVTSSQTTVGLRVYSDSLNRQLNIDGKSPQLTTPNKQDDEPASLFDFEEVARNVLRFVGGVIRGAADSGANEEELNNLFSQAREGVERGISQAQRDLGGFLNDEISTGIENSRELINSEIDELEADIFGRQQFSVAESLTNELFASASQDGSLSIRTRDGDEVRISFESIRQVNQYQSSQYSYQQNDGNENGTGTGTNASLYVEQSQGIQFYQYDGFSFSVEGNLDEAELDAIADLVRQADELAREFFDGDIDLAFEKALELGFDEEELAGFALQLTQRQEVEVVQTYESVSQYNDDENSQRASINPIADYLSSVLNVFDVGRAQLASENDLNSLLNTVVSQIEEVQVPDLISAINRFHNFNQRLLDNVPSQSESAPVENTAE